MAYSFSASIMLAAGLGTEAIIFFFSAFEKPHVEPDWSLVYPELAYMEDPDSAKRPAQQLDEALKRAKIDNELIESFNEGLRSFGESAKQLNETVAAASNISEYNNQIEVDIKKIKKKLKKEESRLNKQEIFLLSEILFSAKNKEKLDKKYKKILKSIKEIGFKNTANIYSISDTAKFGGSLGWIQQNQISKIIINELSKINVGEFTKAISIPAGLLIVKIDQKKVNELDIDFDLEFKKAPG